MSFLIPTDWLAKPEPWDITPLDVYWAAERLGIDPHSIVALWPFWEGAGAPKDCVGTYDLTVQGSPSWAGHGFDVYPAYLTNPASSPFQQAVFSAVVCVDLGNPNTSSSGAFFSSGSTSTSGSWGICRYYKGANDIFGHFETGAGSAINLYTGIGSGNRILAACVSDGSQYLAYANKVAVTNSANGIYTGTWGIYFGNWGDTGRWEDGVVSFAMYLSSALSVDQLDRLQDDPYALIRPPRRPFIFDLGAGLTYQLSGQASGIASLTGAAALAAGIAGSAQALASAAAEARLTEALAGAVSALATLTGDATTGTLLDLSGSVTAAGAATAEAAMRAALAGDAAGLAQILDAVCQARARLQGAVQAAGQAGLDARVAVPLAGTIDALGQAAGTLVELGESLGLLTDPRLRDVTKRWNLILAKRFTLRAS